MQNTSNINIAWYDVNIASYVEEKLDLAMTAYQPFCSFVPQGGHILDAGCGPGRDTRYFISQGFRVTAFDASAEMAKFATNYCGQPVQQLRFQDITYDNEFDAIWASASLLHVPKSEIKAVFSRLMQALIPGGVFMMSFKYGDGEQMRAGRLFNDYTEASLQCLFDSYKNITPIKIWKADDFRDPSRQPWVYALVRKTSAV